MFSTGTIVPVSTACPVWPGGRVSVAVIVAPGRRCQGGAAEGGWHKSRSWSEMAVSGNLKKTVNDNLCAGRGLIGLANPSRC
jgi:hypothetical protein